MEVARVFPVGMGDSGATTVPGEVQPTALKRGRKRKEGPQNDFPFWLPDGWIMKTRERKGGRFVKSYTCPISGRTFHSADTALHYLHFVLVPPDLENDVNNVDDLKLQPKVGFNNDRIYDDNNRFTAKEDSPTWLPEGWIMEVRHRMHGSRSGHKYKCYIDSVSGSKFCTLKDVIGYLEGDKSSMAPMDDITESDAIDCDMIVSRFEGSLDGLPNGWIKETRFKQRASGLRKDPYYMDPNSGIVFRSKKDVLNYLETGELSKHCSKKKGKHLGVSSKIEEFNVCPNAIGLKHCDLVRSCEQNTPTNKSLLTRCVGDAREVVELRENIQLALPHGIESKVFPQPTSETKVTQIPDHKESKMFPPSALATKEEQKPDPESKELLPTISEREVNHGANNYFSVTPQPMPYKSSKKLAIRNPSSMWRIDFIEKLLANAVGKESQPLCPAEVAKPEATVRTLEQEKPSVDACMSHDRTVLRPEESEKVLVSTCLSIINSKKVAAPVKSPASSSLQPQTSIKLLETLEDLSKSPEQKTFTASTKDIAGSSCSTIEVQVIPSVCVPHQSSSRSLEPMSSKATIDIRSESIFRTSSSMKTLSSASYKLPECSFEAQEPINIKTALTNKSPEASGNNIDPDKVAATPDDKLTEKSSTAEEPVKTPTTDDLHEATCELCSPSGQGSDLFNDSLLPETGVLPAHSCRELSEFPCQPLQNSSQLLEKSKEVASVSDKSPLCPSVLFDYVDEKISNIKTAKLAGHEPVTCKLKEKPCEQIGSTEMVVNGSELSDCFGTRSVWDIGGGREMPVKAILLDFGSKLVRPLEPDMSHDMVDEKPCRETIKKRSPQVISVDSAAQKKPDVKELDSSLSDDGSCEILEETPPTQVSSKTRGRISHGSPRRFGLRSAKSSTNTPIAPLFDSSKRKKADVQVNSSEQDVSSERLEPKLTGNIRGRDKYEKNGTPEIPSEDKSSYSHGSHRGFKSSKGRGMSRGSGTSRASNQSNVTTPSDKSMPSDRGGVSSRGVGSGSRRTAGSSSNGRGRGKTVLKHRLRSSMRPTRRSTRLK